MAQRGRDEDAVVALLPQANDGHFHATLDGSDVGEALAANGRSAAELAGARDLGHGLRMAHGLAGIGLHRRDEAAAERVDKGLG